MITGIRILPPLAIARLGSSPTPMENYHVRVDPAHPLAFRTLEGAETLVVDRATGGITRQPAAQNVRFKDGQDGEQNRRVKPIAPFLEVWCDRGDGILRPLTTTILAEEGLTAASVSWQVRASNIKAFRRTRDDRDTINADTAPFTDHAVHTLIGKCTNFVQGKTIAFGDVQYILPTTDLPEIRLRFTPAAGLVFGSMKTPDDPNVRENVYLADSLWSSHADSGGPTTVPGEIYFGERQPNGDWLSRGYLDDTCDGIVDVSLTIGGNTLTAFARISSGPPDYAPDSMPVRTVADELEQALFGPGVAPQDASPAAVEEILRRAVETVRLQNTIALNGNLTFRTADGRVIGASNGMALNDMGPRGQNPRTEPPTPIMAPALVDNLALRALHQSILTALRGDTAAWFGEVLRDYPDVSDLTDAGRRKMPAMMRGADGNHLALARRQVDMVRQTSAQARNLQQAPPAGGEPAATPLNQTAQAAARPLVVETLEGRFAPGEIRTAALIEQLSYRGKGNPPGTLPTTAISNCFPGLEFDLRNAWRRIFEEVELWEFAPFIIQEGQFVAIIRAIEIDGRRISLFGRQHVPTETQEPPEDVVLELSNVLADLVTRPGTRVRCFIDTTGDGTISQEIELTVRGLFEPGTAVIGKAQVLPGELTQSLCSPWQNDYRECGCYYWAASRPDYVNVEPAPDGTSAGDNWMQVRTSTSEKHYSPDISEQDRLIAYVDLFRNWEQLLRFVVGGNDRE